MLVLSALLSAAVAAGDPSGLSVKIGRKTAKLRSALSYTHGELARTVVLSTEPLTCAGLLSDEARPAPRETRLQLAVAPVLAPDGGARWQLTQLVHLPRSMHPEATISEPSASGGSVQLSVDIEHDEPADTFLELPAVRYAVHGVLIAEDCGEQPIDPGAAAQPQGALTLTIAGEEIPVLAANRFDDRLVLSSQPHGCGAIAADADFSLEVRLTDAQEAEMVFVRGARLPMQYTVGVGPAWGSTLDVSGSGADLELDGALDMLGYPVRLSGRVSAQACP